MPQSTPGQPVAAALGLHRVEIGFLDLDRSVDFYQGLLGFRDIPGPTHSRLLTRGTGVLEGPVGFRGDRGHPPPRRSAGLLDDVSAGGSGGAGGLQLRRADRAERPLGRGRRRPRPPWCRAVPARRSRPAVPGGARRRTRPTQRRFGVSLVLVTGSSDGIGAEIARVIAAQGHQVILHARNEQRAEGLADVAVGDLASLASTRELAADVLRIGKPDVVVHNAGWGSKDAERPVTEDGLEQTFQVNALAPFLLTALLPLPQRLVFVSSDSITRGVIRIDDLQHEQEWTADAAYADSKLVMTSLAFGMARRWPGLLSNAVHPGWVRTK